MQIFVICVKRHTKAIEVVNQFIVTNYFLRSLPSVTQTLQVCYSNRKHRSKFRIEVLRQNLPCTFISGDVKDLKIFSVLAALAQ